MLLQLFQFLPVVFNFQCSRMLEDRQKQPVNGLPAGDVYNSVEVVTLDKQAADGEKRQLPVLPDLQVFQVLGKACT